MREVILASKSPRRKELLELLGISFKICVSDKEEYFDSSLKIVDALQKVALSKALDIALQYPQDVVIGADTIVVVDDTILGKPKNEEDAKRMLQMLSNRTHHVYTGVAICCDGKYETFYEDTEVMFYALDEELIDRYIATKESNDKAGAYGIQGKGSVLVKEIKGDYNNVVGLPIAKLYRYLQKYIHI